MIKLKKNEKIEKWKQKGMNQIFCRNFLTCFCVIMNNHFKPYNPKSLIFRMKRKHSLFFLLIYHLIQCFTAMAKSLHSVSCRESVRNGVEMEITMEKQFFMKTFPFRVKDFQELNGFFQKTIYQDQLEVEFTNQDCKLSTKNFRKYFKHHLEN